MYCVSRNKIIWEKQKQYEIYIIDGQNISQIEQYHKVDDNNWDPCIPTPFVNDSKIWGVIITFTFDPVNIQNMNDWYPFQVCNKSENITKYRNKYLFDMGYAHGIFNNLIINDYTINNNTNYPIITSKGILQILGHTAQIILNNVSIHNVSSSISSALVDTFAAIDIIKSEFMDITVSNTIFHINFTNTFGIATALNSHSQECKFVNIMADNIFRVTYRDYNTEPGFDVPSLSLRNSIFTDVKTNKIIYDDTVRSKIDIQDTVMEINQGVIYSQTHLYQSYTGV